jgi:hypothetical protein
MRCRVKVLAFGGGWGSWQMGEARAKIVGTLLLTVLAGFPNRRSERGELGLRDKLPLQPLQ